MKRRRILNAEEISGPKSVDFKCTKEVQSVELKAGTYKLLCWGAQGGSGGSYSGGKGGYSEGILTLTEPKTLYVFVGGAGTTSGNGGWNCGGGGTGSSSYTSGGETGSTKYGGGGGATDICTVTSDMSYSSYVNNRSQESLLSRMIVAGGGSGASYAEKVVQSSNSYYSSVLKQASDNVTNFKTTTYAEFGVSFTLTEDISPGDKLKMYYTTDYSNFIYSRIQVNYTDGSVSKITDDYLPSNGKEITINSNYNPNKGV